MEYIRYLDCDDGQRIAWEHIEKTAHAYIMGLCEICLDTSNSNAIHWSAWNALYDLEGLSESVFLQTLSTAYSEGDLGTLYNCGEHFLKAVSKQFAEKYRTYALEKFGCYC